MDTDKKVGITQRPLRRFLTTYRCSSVFICGFILFFLLTTSRSVAQDPPPKQSDDIIRLNTELVVLEAEVLSQRTGQPIGSLKQSDFAIYEDGIKQEINYFSYDRLPLSIVLL